MIRVQDFHKAYEKTIAVSGISFDVQPGQILGLVGPNGAGKTTTLKALSTIIPLTRGRMSVREFDVETQSVDVRRRLAYVPDDPQLFPDLTVEQHLAFTASAYAVENADEKAARLLEQFHLDDRRRTPAADLSRGMRQKLAICCAYLHDPAALLFDEPMTGLDPFGIRMLKQSIRQRADAGTAVIVSSHLLAVVEDICTHVLILDKGRQRFVGTLEELKQTFVSPEQAATLERIFFLATCDEPASRELVDVAV